MEKSEYSQERQISKRGEKRDVKEMRKLHKRLTSEGLNVSTPSVRLCFRLLLFCLIDWT